MSIYTFSNIMAEGTWEDIVTLEQFDRAATEKLVKADVVRMVARLVEERNTLKEVHANTTANIQNLLDNEVTKTEELETQVNDKDTEIQNLTEQIEGKNNIEGELEQERNSKKQLESKVTELEAKINEEKDAKQELMDKMQQQQELIDQKEEQRKELLEMVSQNESMTDKNNNNETVESSILFITHPRMKNIQKALPSHWEYMEIEKITDLRPLIRDGDSIGKSYDKVVLFLGSEAVIQKSSSITGHKAFNELKQYALELTETTEVAIVQIPPTKIPGMGGNVDLFNHKIAKLEIENIEKVIYTKDLEDAIKERVVEKDKFSLSEFGAKLYKDVIDKISIPDPNAKSEQKCKIGKVTEFIEIKDEHVKHVIGKRGKQLSQVTEGIQVQISFGKFVEQPKQGQKTVKSTSGYIITGPHESNNVAKKRIRDISDSIGDFDQEPQAKVAKLK